MFLFIFGTLTNTFAYLFVLGESLGEYAPFHFFYFPYVASDTGTSIFTAHVDEAFVSYTIF